MYSEIIGIKLDVKENNYIVTIGLNILSMINNKSYNNIVNIVGTCISYNF